MNNGDLKKYLAMCEDYAPVKRHADGSECKAKSPDDCPFNKSAENGEKGIEGDERKLDDSGSGDKDTILGGNDGDIGAWLENHHPDWQTDLDPNDRYNGGKMSHEALKLLEDIWNDPSSYFDEGESYNAEIKRLRKLIRDAGDGGNSSDWIGDGIRDYLQSNAPFSVRVGDYR